MMLCRGETGEKDTSSNKTEENAGDVPPCCRGKEKYDDGATASMFEFFKDSGKTKESTGPAMLGHCQSVEGGLKACVWVPQQDDAPHKIVF